MRCLIVAVAAVASALVISIAARAESYKYDGLGRLIQVDFDDGQVIKYAYDDAGNRTLVEQGGAPTPQDDSASTGEDASVEIDVLANDFDLNGDALSIASIGAPAHGTAQVIDVNGADWVRYAPALNFNGSDSFTYTVTDGTGQATANVIVSVIADNDPPIAVNDSVSTNEDVQKTFDPRSNDSEPDGGILTITAKTNGSKGTVAIVNNGTQLRYTPNANINGSDSFSYTVSDGVLNDTAIVTMTINAVNDAPNASNDTISTSEDTAKTFDPRTNDSDIETANSALVIIAKTNGSKGMVAIVNNGTQLRYTPNANFNGSDSFTYTVSDGALSDTATVSVTVNSINDPPNAVNDSRSTNEDTPLTLDPRANDVDVDGQTLTIAAKTNGSKGVVAIVNNGTQLRYTPNANFNGSDSFTYTVSDGELSDTATVSMTVHSVNDAPNANADAYYGVQRNTWTVLNVLANDVDLDDDALSISSVSGACGAAQIINGGEAINYTGQGCPSIEDYFTYSVSDGKGGSDVGLIEVHSSGGGGFPEP